MMEDATTAFYNGGGSGGDSLLWKKYKDLISKYRAEVSLLHDTLSQLLLYPIIPTTGQWREVIYGLLSLFDMSIDMAQRDETAHHSLRHGTTVELEVENQQSNHAYYLRIAITVLHNLLPTLMQMVSPNKRPNTRYRIEQVKFLLRATLLITYWYQIYQSNYSNCCGILQDGGMCEAHNNSNIWTITEEQSRQERLVYVGRRTGRTVISNTIDNISNNNTSNKIPILSSSSSRDFMMIVGELLNLYRPLHWAHIELRPRRPSLHDLGSALAMDLISLGLVQQRASSSSPHALELQRRKTKLLLYLLRSPILDRYTQPTLTKFLTTLAKVPLFGPLVQSYLSEWFQYFSHAYVTERD